MITWLIAVGLTVFIFSTFGLPFITGPRFSGRVVLPDLSRLFQGNIPLLQLILAFVLPPAAVYMKVGVSFHFWLNVLLTALGWIPGILHALWVLFYL